MHRKLKLRRNRQKSRKQRQLQSRRQPENWRVILPVQRILQRSHLTIIQANQIRATAIPAIRQAQAVLQQPEQRPVMPVEQLEAVITPILLTIVQLRHMSIPGCCMRAAVIMRRRLLRKPGTSRYIVRFAYAMIVELT